MGALHSSRNTKLVIKQLHSVKSDVKQCVFSLVLCLSHVNLVGPISVSYFD